MILDHNGKPINFSYKGAKNNQRNRDYFSGSSSINNREEKVLSESERESLLSNLRNSYRNNIITSSIIECLQTNIGKVRVQSTTGNEDFDLKREKIFKNYLSNCEITGIDMATVLKLIMQELALAGDCLIILLKDMQFQLVSSERICSSRNPELRKPDEISGVRVNKFGAITHYRIINYDESGKLNKDKGTYIPAKDGIFIRNQTRIGSLRGIPFLASGINALQNIEEVQSAYTQKIKINSLFACAITSNNPYDDRWSMNNNSEDNRSSFTTLETGQLMVLEPNENITTIDASSGTNEIEKFLLYLITFIASPIVGCPEQIVGYSNGTFASSRVTKTQANFKFKQYREMLEDQLLKRLFAWLTRKNQLMGNLPEMEFSDYQDSCIFNWTYLPVLDKSKDYAVDKMAIENNLASYTEIFAEKGKDFKQEAEQIAQDKLLLQKLFQEEEESNTDEPSVSNTNTDSEDIKKKIEAYGIGVRGGSITPQEKDEEYFRSSLNLPEPNEAIKNAWEEDGGARRPITLKSQEAFEEEQNQISEDTDETLEESEEESE